MFITPTTVHNPITSHPNPSGVFNRYMHLMTRILEVLIIMDIRTEVELINFVPVGIQLLPSGHWASTSEASSTFGETNIHAIPGVVVRHYSQSQIESITFKL